MGRWSTESRSPSQGRLGQVLGGVWRLDAVLGIGGMAAVYAATHRDGRRAAIKVLHTALSHDETVRNRFLREGYVANHVAHPGAVAILAEDVAEDGTAFLVMELLDGETLDARWRSHDGAVPAEDVLAIADQLLDVLAAAHDRGIVHRDLKPENLFLTRDGRVKVLDFGIAKLRQAACAAELTRSGLLMGTPSFMPPEQIRGQWSEVDERSDLWAVGALMFTLLSGRHVHESESAADLMIASATEPAPPLADVASVRVELADIVDRALAFDREDRWPSARAMQRAVREARRMSARPETSRISVHFDDDLAFAPTDDGSSFSVDSGSYPAAPALTALPPAPPPFSAIQLGLAGATAALALAAKVVVACVILAELTTICPSDAAAAMRVEPSRTVAAVTR